jgi:hypothetical protein
MNQCWVFLLCGCTFGIGFAASGQARRNWNRVLPLTWICIPERKWLPGGAKIWSPDWRRKVLLLIC